MIKPVLVVNEKHPDNGTGDVYTNWIMTHPNTEGKFIEAYIHTINPEMEFENTQPMYIITVEELSRLQMYERLKEHNNFAATLQNQLWLELKQRSIEKIKDYFEKEMSDGKGKEKTKNFKKLCKKQRSKVTKIRS